MLVSEINYIYFIDPATRAGQVRLPVSGQSEIFEQLVRKSDESFWKDTKWGVSSHGTGGPGCPGD